VDVWFGLKVVVWELDPKVPPTEKRRRPLSDIEMSPVVGSADVASRRNLADPEIEMPPVKLLVPARMKSPLPEPCNVRCFDAPLMLLETVKLPLPSITTTLSVKFANATAIVDVPFCRVAPTELLLRKITLLTPFTLAPLRVSVPFVEPALLLIVTAPLDRPEVISMAPIAWFAVPLLVVLLIVIVSVVAELGLTPNCATSVVSGADPPVQLEPVSHAEPPVLLQRISLA
jgi:hypothetical protein